MARRATIASARSFWRRPNQVSGIPSAGQSRSSSACSSARVPAGKRSAMSCKSIPRLWAELPAARPPHDSSIHRSGHTAAVSSEDGETGTSASSGYRGASVAVSYTHLRAHETRHDLVCRLLLEKKKKTKKKKKKHKI